jgi:uncharacterized protein
MSESNLDVITGVYRAFQARDFGVVERYFHPDVEIVQTSQLPWGGRHHGHEGAITFFRTLLAHVEPDVEVERLFAAGDDVVQIGHTRGKTVATGTPFDVTEVHVWRLRDGLVVRYEAYIDTPAMLGALGPAG